MSGARHKYLKAFKAADKDNSGSLNRSELTEALSSQGLPTSEVQKLMDELDLNGDGIINLHEYEVALGISTQPMDAWEELFKELDKDNSGVIDFNELCAFLKSSGADDLIPILGDWMADYDTNNDQKLNYKEFMGFICSLNE